MVWSMKGEDSKMGQQLPFLIKPLHIKVLSSDLWDNSMVTSNFYVQLLFLVPISSFTFIYVFFKDLYSMAILMLINLMSLL